jgi:hypothetical protein
MEDDMEKSPYQLKKEEMKTRFKKELEDGTIDFTRWRVEDKVTHDVLRYDRITVFSTATGEVFSTYYESVHADEMVRVTAMNNGLLKMLKEQGIVVISKTELVGQGAYRLLPEFR